MDTGGQVKERLYSLDALRGFDMFFIMSGEAWVCIVLALCGIKDVYSSIQHVAWHGLHFMDAIFPLFLFLAGVSFPFSAAKSRERGLSTGKIALKAVKRGIILVLLGMVYNGALKDFDHIRYCSVLGRIGIAWMFGALLYLAMGWKGRLLSIAGLLVFSSLFFRFVLAPDAPAGADPFSAAGNFGCWLDRVLLKVGGGYDPEGFAGLVPSIATAMLGMSAGDMVRMGGETPTTRKTLALLGCGALCAAIGFALMPVVPLNKKLWTSSFVLVLGGYSFALFAIFYWIIDVKKKRRWAFFFRVIGLNSITIYLAQQIVNFGAINKFFVAGTVELLPHLWGRLLTVSSYIAVCWLFLYFLYNRKIFLRV